MNLEKLLYRIILGYYFLKINEETYKVVVPDFKLKYDAETLYDNIIEENKFDKRLLTNEEIKIYLINNGVWSPNDDQKIKNLEQQVDDTKVDLYLNFSNSRKKELFYKNIKYLENALSQLNSRKNSFNYLSIEDHAISIKNEFIIMNTLYDKNNNLVFNTNEETNYIILQNFIKEILEHIITAKQMRELVKSSVWKSYSSSCNVQRDILNTDDDYKHLINFHNMYNNVRQHPECPSEDIINDDYALDGWYIHQNRKAEKEKKKNAILEKVGGNIKDGAGHVFVFTNNEEEIKAINELNGPEEKQFKSEILEHAKKNENTNWNDLPAVKRQNQIELEKIKKQFKK
jgi:hypothetical protein